MSTDLSKTEDFVTDLVERAASTAWQAGLPVLGGLFASGAFNVSHFDNVSDAKRTIAAAAVAVGGAVLSALKSTAKAYWKANHGAIEAQGKADLTDVEQLAKNKGITL